MDPYSAEGELVNIHTAFHQAQYAKVLSFDTTALSPSNALPARILKLRAQIALQHYDDVLSDIAGEEDAVPDLAAAGILARWSQSQASGSDDGAALDEAAQLAARERDNLSVQLLCGTVLAGAGRYDEALGLLGRHQGSLDAVALIVQIHLLQNRPDLAAKEAQNARKWAQDSLLVNLAEAWVGLRRGGEHYQSSFYVFEELAQSPSSQSLPSLLAQSIAELHLHRLPEAEAALQQAADLDAENADVLANTVALNTILGRAAEARECWERLEKMPEGRREHTLVADLRARREEFGRAAEKFSPRFEI